MARAKEELDDLRTDETGSMNTATRHVQDPLRPERTDAHLHATHRFGSRDRVRPGTGPTLTCHRSRCGVAELGGAAGPCCRSSCSCGSAPTGIM